MQTSVEKAEIVCHFQERLAMCAKCEYCAFIHFVKCVMLCRRWDNFCLGGIISKMKDHVKHVPTL